MNTPSSARARLAPSLIILTLGGAIIALLVGLARPRSSAPDAGDMARAESAEAIPAPPTPAVEPAQAPAPPEIIRTADSPLADLQLSLKLDPRLTRGLYMGDRWVSPPTYTRVGDLRGCSAEVKVQGIDAQGKPLAVAPQWTVADPSVVAVSAGLDNAVNVTVQHPGQTTVEVSALGFTKRLALNATERDGILVMELSQPPSPAVPVAQATPAYPALASGSGQPAPLGQTARSHRHRRGQLVPIPEELSGVVAQFQAAQQMLGASVPAAPGSAPEGPQ